MKGLIAAGLIWLAVLTGVVLGCLLVAALAVCAYVVAVLTWPFRGRPSVVVLPPVAPYDQAAMFAAYEQELPRRVHRLADRIPPRSEVTR